MRAARPLRLFTDEYRTPVDPESVARGVALLLLVLYLPPLRNLFHFSTLHLGDLVICLGAGTLSVLWFEGLKVVRRGQRNSQQSSEVAVRGQGRDDFG